MYFTDILYGLFKCVGIFMLAHPSCFHLVSVLFVHIGNFVIQFDDFVGTYLQYFIFTFCPCISFFFFQKSCNGTPAPKVLSLSRILLYL